MGRSIGVKTIALIFMLVFSFLMLDFLENARCEEKIRLAVSDFTKTSQKPEHANLNQIVAEWLALFLVNAGAVEVPDSKIGRKY